MHVRPGHHAAGVDGRFDPGQTQKTANPLRPAFRLGAALQEGWGWTDDGVEVYEWAIASRHPEFGPLASIYLSELVLSTLQDPPDADYEPVEALTRPVAASGHPEHAPVAAWVLDDVAASRDRREVAP